MASSSSKDHELELREVPTPSTDRQDDLALAKLGKKAVLKVEPRQGDFLIDRSDCSATFWIPLYPRLQLHCSHHLGRFSGVSRFDTHEKCSC